MKPIKHIICSSVLLACVMSVGATHAYAKAAAAPAASKCQAAAGTGNADLESTRSACRLVDGAVGFAARPNTGDGAVEEFNAVRPEPTLRQPQFSSTSSSLPLPDSTPGKSQVAAGGATTEDSWGTGRHTDIFVQPTRQSPLEGWNADGGYSRVASNTGNAAEDVPFSSFAATSGYRAQDVAATGGGNARSGIGANNTGTPVVDTTTPSGAGTGTGDVTTPSGLGDGTTPSGTNDGTAGTGTGTGDAGTGLGDGTVGDGTAGLGGDGANPANPTEVPAVPEPQTYLMLLVGLAMVVGLGRKARRAL